MRQLYTAFKPSSRAQLNIAVRSLERDDPASGCTARDVKKAVNTFSAALKRRWHPLIAPPHELRLDITLTTGQCFGWKRYNPLTVKVKQETKDYFAKSRNVPHVVATNDEQYFYGVIGSYVFLLKQTPLDTHYQVLNDCNSNSATEIQRTTSILRDYFQLETNLEDLYLTWKSKSNQRFASIFLALPGLRVLRQDPVECLFSFICSSNNNISRIILMLDRLRERYGEKLWDDNELGIKCYSFPSIARLAEATEDELRALGFGYRAPWIRGPRSR